MALSRLAFYPSLGYNYIMSMTSTRHWYDRIDETVIVGALPLRSVVEKLVREENVKGMVTMNEQYEMKYFTHSDEELFALGVERLQASTADLVATPSQENILRAVDFIQSHRRRGNSVSTNGSLSKPTTSSKQNDLMLGYGRSSGTPFIDSMTIIASPDTSQRHPLVDKTNVYDTVCML